VSPYLAILTDSFREAFASRVLWIVLGLATLILVILAGFGLEEHAGASFTKEDIGDALGLYNKITQQAAAPYPTPGKRIWSLVDDETKQELGDIVEAAESTAFGNPLATQLTAMLNRLLGRRDLYEAASWRFARLDTETRELVSAGSNNLSDEELARLNRLLIEAGFPFEVSPSRALELYVSYWGNTLGTPLPVRREFVIKSTMLIFSNLMVGMLGVFCGIIVTASIVPQTFEPGAVDLLLSKPVSRPMVFLTKFIGGCLFTAITAVYILGGLWLIVGWRHGIWHPALLWSIPVFLFVFAVYYSVSAVAGLVWRNTIVAVVVTVVFWLVCWGVGNIKGFIIENFFFDPVRPIRLLAAGDDLIAGNERGQIVRWNEDSGRWEEILVADEARRWRPFGGGLPLAGPVYEPEDERLAVVQKPTRRFALLSSTVPLVLGGRSENWRRREGISVPSDTTLLARDEEGRLLFVTGQGMLRQKGELAGKAARSPEIFGVRLPAVLGGNAEALEHVLVARLSHPYSAAVNAQSGEVAIYNREVLAVYARNEKGTYEERLRKELAGSDSGVVAFGGNAILLGSADGAVRVFNSRDMTLRSRWAPAEGVAPRFVEAAPDGGHFAVLLHDRTLWIYDEGRDELERAEVTGQEDITAFAFNGPARLLVADRVTRVSEYRLDDLALVRRAEMEPDWLETLYRYMVVPIHKVFPKPTEINNITTYLLTEQKTIVAGPRDGDLRTRRLKLDLWGPVWSNLGFLAAMLAIGCVYVWRKDF
jgi:hypothetical protein